MSDALGSDTPATPDQGRRWTVIFRALTLSVFVAVAVAVGLLVPLPSIDQLRENVDALGWAGGVVFALTYAAITLTPAPKNVLSVAAGLVFGFGNALVLVYAGALLGAAAAFGLGRGELVRRRGLMAIIGARLIPVIPFTAINYGAGLTAVRRRDYALGTALGIIPGTVAYVALGAFGLQLGWPAWVAIGVLGALTVAGAIWAERGRRVSRRAVADRPEPDAVTDA